MFSWGSRKGNLAWNESIKYTYKLILHWNRKPYFMLKVLQTHFFISWQKLLQSQQSRCQKNVHRGCYGPILLPLIRRLFTGLFSISRLWPIHPEVLIKDFFKQGIYVRNVLAPPYNNSKKMLRRSQRPSKHLWMHG